MMLPFLPIGQEKNSYNFDPIHVDGFCSVGCRFLLFDALREEVGAPTEQSAIARLKRSRARHLRIAVSRNKNPCQSPGPAGLEAWKQDGVTLNHLVASGCCPSRPCGLQWRVARGLFLRRRPRKSCPDPLETLVHPRLIPEPWLLWGLDRHETVVWVLGRCLELPVRELIPRRAGTPPGLATGGPQLMPSATFSA